MNARVRVILLAVALSAPLFAQDPTSTVRPQKLRIISQAQTANYIAKFDAGGALSDSLLYESGGKVGVGTSSPAEKLHVFSSENLGTVILAQNTSTGSDGFAAFRATSNLSATSFVAHGNRTASESRFGILLNGWGEIVHFNGNGQVIGTTTNTPLVFGTGNAERMRIHGNGKVSIGAQNSTGQLNIVGSAVTASSGSGYGVWAHQSSSLTANGTQHATGAYMLAVHSIPGGATNSGSVVGGQFDGWNYGPGTLNNATGGSFFAGNLPTTNGTVTNAYGIKSTVIQAGGTVVNGYGLFIVDTEATHDWGVYQQGVSDTNYFAGNVLIGTVPNQQVEILTVKGNAHFHGIVSGTNIRAHYQDVAEWVPATTDLTPGTVVILNGERNNEVMASATSYDTTVAGVVSAQPGISLGVEGDGKEQIATTGRVKVRVDARMTPIRIGDLLVTSDMPGTAMRSEPMDINGRKFHQPGTIIGKALEPLEGGIGEILVLLSLQ